jgi:hypothetical protein
MTVSIQLTQGQVAVVDDEDADLAEIGWHAHKGNRTFYATRHVFKSDGTRTTQDLHLIVAARIGLDPTLEVDHKDRNGLNCIRSNLRSATRSQNGANRAMRSDNTSGVKGVAFHKATGKWQADVRSGGKKHYLGLFVDIHDAEAAVKAFREKVHGEYACHG